MDIKCKNCNAQRDFRNQRGNKIADITCSCGGKFERINIYTSRSGVCPLGEDFTYRYTSNDLEYVYFYVYKSKSGFFILNHKEHKFYPYDNH